MSAHLSDDVPAEPNLTPILDMVFQLITFFMLVINFKAAEIDLSLKLPVVGSARPVETHGQRGLLVLNVDERGSLNVYGRVVTDVEDYIATEAVAVRMATRTTRDDAAAGDLATTVVIRADRATPFKLLNRVIKSCQEQGFRRFALKAVNKEL